MTCQLCCVRSTVRVLADAEIAVGAGGASGGSGAGRGAGQQHRQQVHRLNARVNYLSIELAGGMHLTGPDELLPFFIGWCYTVGSSHAPQLGRY